MYKNCDILHVLGCLDCDILHALWRLDCDILQVLGCLDCDILHVFLQIEEEQRRGNSSLEPRMD